MFFNRKQQSPEQFWQWFSKNSDKYYNFNLNNRYAYLLLNQMGKKLNAFGNGVVFELSPLEGKTRTLVISADGIKANIPAVQELVAAAPDLPNWAVKGFRQRKGSEYVEYNKQRLYPNDVYFIAKPNPENKLDLTLYVKGWDSSVTLGSLGFLLLDDVLGEYDVMTQIGEIQWQDLADKPSDAKPASDLPNVVDAHKG